MGPGLWNWGPFAVRVGPWCDRSPRVEQGDGHCAHRVMGHNAYGTSSCAFPLVRGDPRTTTPMTGSDNDAGAHPMHRDRHPGVGAEHEIHEGARSTWIGAT